MGEVIVVSNVPIYILGIIAVFCYLWGSFVCYKKAVESHVEDNVIFDIMVLSAFWAFILGRISFVISHINVFIRHPIRTFLVINYPGFDRWGAILGIIVGILIIIRKKRGKYFDFFDLAILGYFSGVSYFWIGLNFIGFSYLNLLIGLFNFGMFLFFWKLEKTYRLISWYRGSKTFSKSGLVSGLGLSTIALSFLIENLVFRNLDVGNTIFTVLLFILGIVLVYIRSGRLLADDIQYLKLWKKKN